MSARSACRRESDDYLAERRRLGFELRSQDTFLADFATVRRRSASPRSPDRRTDGRLGANGVKRVLERRKPGTAGWRNCAASSAICNSSSRKLRCPRRRSSGLNQAGWRPTSTARMRSSICWPLRAQLGPRRQLASGDLRNLIWSDGLDRVARVRSHFTCGDTDVDLKRGMLTVRQFAHRRRGHVFDADGARLGEFQAVRIDFDKGRRRLGRRSGCRTGRHRCAALGHQPGKTMLGVALHALHDRHRHHSACCPDKSWSRRAHRSGQRSLASGKWRLRLSNVTWRTLPPTRRLSTKRWVI